MILHHNFKLVTAAISDGQPCSICQAEALLHALGTDVNILKQHTAGGGGGVSEGGA